MAYDALEESLQALRGDAPRSGVALSRRTRHAALAADRDGDVAATLFLRRGVSGEPWIDVHALELAGGTWRLVGGSSSNTGDDAFAPRPAMRELGAPAVPHGGGRTVRNADRLMPWGARWVRWAQLRAATEVSQLLVNGRVVTVADHGIAVVVWARRTPQVVAQDAGGASLGAVPIRNPHRATRLERT